MAERGKLAARFKFGRVLVATPAIQNLSKAGCGVFQRINLEEKTCYLICFTNNELPKMTLDGFSLNSQGLIMPYHITILAMYLLRVENSILLNWFVGIRRILQFPPSFLY